MVTRSDYIEILGEEGIDKESASELFDLCEKAGKAEPKLGSGERFQKLAGSLKKKGAKDPEALAAWIGRKKYGKEKFQKLSVAGRKESVEEAISLVVSGTSPSDALSKIIG